MYNVMSIQLETQLYNFDMILLGIQHVASIILHVKNG